MRPDPLRSPAPALELLVDVEDERWGRLLSREPEDLARRAVDAVAARFDDIAGPAELGIRLSVDEEVRALNRQWRGKDKATNILSFPSPAMAAASMPHRLLGDLILAFETLEHEAEEAGKSADDHFIHLIVHGFLHLLGYDHETDREAREMERLEVDILASLSIADPYAEADDPADAPEQLERERR